MAEKQTYDLTSPNGTQITVEGAVRRDELVRRGYAEGHSKPKAAPKPKAKGA